MILIGSRRRSAICFHGIKVIQGGPPAGLYMGAHQGSGLLEILLDQSINNIQMFQSGVMDLNQILFAGDDYLGIVVKKIVHHIYDIPVTTVFNNPG